MRKQKLRQLLAVLLTLCLLLGCVPAVFAADQTKELELQQTPVSISPENENVETDAADEPAPEETVRVIIRFRSDSLTGHGYSTRGLGSNAAALAYSDRLQKEQRTQIKAISAELGVTLPVRYQFTIGVNGVARVCPTARWRRSAPWTALRASMWKSVRAGCRRAQHGYGRHDDRLL